ncbi:MAG TPA: helix-turn-helix transcriptional regulator [Anaerolineaceae bacterium]|nr:helix-turn-helix transcriptional regulator [Anaerolineaceae bacterium]
MSLPESFSEREKEVAGLLLQGKSNKQIAQGLGISTRTAEFHLSHIYEKLGVASRTEAILALSEGHLRESAGGDLRESPVDGEPVRYENGGNLTISSRRFTMRKLLLFFVALITLICLVSVVAILFFNLQARQSGVQEVFPEAEQQIVPAPTYTPWITPTPFEPTYTPWVVETAPQPVLTAAPILPVDGRYSFEGVSLAVDPVVASGLTGQVIPENPGSPDGPGWEIRPQYVQLSPDGYPLEGTFHAPVISVFPTGDYRRLAPLAGEQVDELAALLAEKPAAPDQIPFLPLINAGQVFRSNVEYLEFQNGSGVRYLTLLGQYPAPANNHELFYTFQGLTADGRQMISMVLPVNHPSLRENADAFSQSEMEAIWADPDYYPNITASLSAEPAGSFTPDLAALDALVESLEIDR